MNEDQILEEARTEAPLCSHCSGSPKQQWLDSQRWRVKIQVSAIGPASEHALIQTDSVIQGNLTQLEVCDLAKPNVPESGVIVPTTEW